MNRILRLSVALRILTLGLVAAGSATTPAPLAAQPSQASSERAATLLPETGRHHHPIATKSVEAQTFFDQGITLLFGFNHAEAARAFRRAAELDPEAAMPHWGIALVLGPNYNRDIDPVDSARNKAAHEALERALALSAGAPKHEQAYVKALVKRYSIDPKADGKQLEVDYRNAMREVMRAYPDDLDAATLYVESIMNLRPWQLWTPDGKPAEATEEAVSILEGVLRRAPEHIGANHYYVHALEASPYPERALPSAARLMSLVPWSGHLVHMPSHIYMHTGDYQLLAQANERAAKADEDYFALTGTTGVYRMNYYTHNVHFIAVAYAAQGRLEEAKRAADKLAAIVGPNLAQMPALESYMQVPLLVLVRFHRWDEILNTPAPDPARPLSKAFWHYARTLAFVAKGMAGQAAQEQRAFEEVRKGIPAEAVYAYNTVERVLGVASAVLQARFARDPKTAITHWRKAVELEAALSYGEPPDWYYPVRESLGAALLRNGQAEEAERVFRDDLKRSRRNGRSLFGLMESLKAQKKTADAEWVKLEFARAWGQTAPLRIDDL